MSPAWSQRQSLSPKTRSETISCRLVLILFDTIIAAAAFAKSGDENDAAVGQKLMAALAEISRATGTFVLGIDHFGKAVETGTRGTSAKEAAADVVLALLANKALSGEVTAPRVCIRKPARRTSGHRTSVYDEAYSPR